MEWKTVPGQELFIQFSIETGAKLKLNTNVCLNNKDDLDTMCSQDRQ